MWSFCNIYYSNLQHVSCFFTMVIRHSRQFKWMLWQKDSFVCLYLRIYQVQCSKSKAALLSLFLHGSPGIWTTDPLVTRSLLQPFGYCLPQMFIDCCTTQHNKSCNNSKVWLHSLPVFSKSAIYLTKMNGLRFLMLTCLSVCCVICH